MKYIYSRKHPEDLLHIINRVEDISDRSDLTPPDKFLQVATFNFNPDVKIRAHQHRWKKPPKTQVIAQESWVVIKGSIKVFLYDVDGSLLVEEIISDGDCTVTFDGGHKFDVLEENTIIYEFKTGPYLGREMDKFYY